MGYLLSYERGRLTALKWPCFRTIAQYSSQLLCLIYSRVAAAHLARRMPYDSREGRTGEGGVLVPAQHPDRQHPWLRAKLRAFPPALRPAAAQALACQAAGDAAPSFENPFTLADLTVFDDETLCEQLCHAGRLRIASLGAALHGAPEELVRRVAACLPNRAARWRFTSKLRAPIAEHAVAAAQARLLDALFWELTYWKTPQLYDDLVEGEQLHPGIFQRLAPALHDNAVLDAGAGSGRATLACLRAGASRVYAVEPSPGLLRLLCRTLSTDPLGARVTLLRGRFAALPLADNSVRVALSCSAFTAAPEQGGERGLAELRRVTQPDGLIVIIWPRPRDFTWLAAAGFRYVALPIPPEMRVRYRSHASALRVAHRFYARNAAVLRYLQEQRTCEVPYALLGGNPPHDYCWLRTER